MIASLALVGALVLAQDPVRVGGGTVGGAPREPELPATPVAPAPGTASHWLGSVEVAVAVRPRSAPGEYDTALTAGVEAFPVRWGPLGVGLRVGVMLGGTSGVCTDERVDCGFGGGYFGGAVRLTALEAKPVSGWLGLSSSLFGMTGLELEESGFVGIELARVAAGLDVAVPALGGQVGIFAFRSWSIVEGHPPPLVDGRVAMWGGGLRLTLRE